MSKRPLENDDDINMSNPAKKVKLPTIFDGKFFEVIDYNAENRHISAKCTNCILKEKIIRGQSTSTGNFFKHYSNIHPDKHELLRAYCDERNDQRKVKSRATCKVQSILPFTNTLDPKKVS